MDPDFLAGGGVERDQRVVPAGHVDHIVDDDGIEAGQRVGIEPGDLELTDIGFLDLIEIDELGSARSAAEVRPALVGRHACLLGADETDESRRRDERHYETRCPGHIGSLRARVPAGYGNIIRATTDSRKVCLRPAVRESSCRDRPVRHRTIRCSRRVPSLADPSSAAPAGHLA